MFKYFSCYCLRNVCVFLACHRPVVFFVVVFFVLVVLLYYWKMVSEICPVVAADQYAERTVRHLTPCTSVHRRALLVNGCYRPHPL